MHKEAAQFIKAVTKYRSIAIYIPGSPDPDAIASAYAIKLILVYHNIEADIFAEKRVSLPQNRSFIDRLKIPVIFNKEININKYDAYIIPDYQSNQVKNVSGKIPCAAHIDHHGKSINTFKADFSLLRTDVGSTSTLVALIIKYSEIAFSEADMKFMATALTYGLQTDTDKYSNITSVDLEALVFLSEFADSEILEGINNIPHSPLTLQYYYNAMENEVVYKDWAFYGIGYIGARNRDSIAIVADMILKNSTFRVVAVFAIIEDHRKKDTYLDVSLRSGSSSVDLNRLIKKITPNGGGRRYKGAYQVRLNYLQNSPDRDLLWQVVEAATLETLRKSRDTLYITGIERVYGNVKSKVLSLINKGKAEF
jgi:nanoRNase/pAp phosphatase (c-di-AMP/oligoRNAs hydrolase)